MGGANGQPDVSVVMAVKDEEEYVEAAIHSVAEQQGVTVEIVVVDDGSTDRTYELLVELSSRYPSMRVLRNTGKGKVSAFNLGVASSTGRFVCLFAGDDIMLENALADRLSAVSQYSDDVPVVGLCKLITLSDVKRYDGHVVPKAPGKGGLTGASYLMSRKVVERTFPIPAELPNEDTWIELAVLYFDGWKVVHSGIVGYYWRVHSGNSINMFVPFEDYNRKITARMKALQLFEEMHGGSLSPASRQQLAARVECERARTKGSVFGVLASRAGIVDKLRALSIVNGLFYRIRRRLFGLLSGW